MANKLRLTMQPDPSHNQPTFGDQQRQALEQCQHLIDNFADRADRHKAQYKRLQVITVTLAVSTTILSALSASKKLETIEWIVPLVSGLAALSTTLLTQTNSQKMWVQSRTIAQKFQVEQFLYRQSSGEYEIKDETERLQRFSKRIMEIWQQAQENWSQTTSSGK